MRDLTFVGGVETQLFEKAPRRHEISLLSSSSIGGDENEVLENVLESSSTTTVSSTQVVLSIVKLLQAFSLSSDLTKTPRDRDSLVILFLF